MDEQANSPINPKSGFNSSAKTFHNLRPPIHLPTEETPFSAADYALSLHANHSPWPDSLAIINSSTSQKLSYSDFIERIKSLSLYLQNVTQLRKNDTAFILCPNSIKVPILYFSLLSLGVVISPANPISTESEIAHQISLSNPVIAFAISKTCHKLPKLKHGTILIDSPEFDSIITMSPAATTARQDLEKVTVNQSDLAAIMYSSGTTGKVKGVMLTHRNLMAVIAGYYPFKQERKSPTVMLYTVPYFHVFGFFYSFKSVALSETVVVMERFDLKKMLRAVEKFRVTHLAVAPPVVVAMAKSDLTDGYDLRSLETVGCGGAPLYWASLTFGDPKAIGDPYCTIFVGRLSHLTTEDTLRKAMSKYGKVKNLRLVRHIVTGASRGYAFVEFETEREMRRAYKDAQHSYIDDSEIIVDYNRQQLMPGWIPRRLGGGLGGRKESGQLRFGGRERPFRAPLQTIPYDDLKRLGIPPPPEGRYMSHYEVPSPPRRKRSSRDKEESSHRRSSIDKEAEESSNTRSYRDKEEHHGERHSVEKEEHRHKGSSMDRSERSHRRISPERGSYHHKRSSLDREEHYEKRSPVDMEEPSHKKLRDREERTHKRTSRDREEGSRKRHKHGSSSDKRRKEDA